MGWKFIACSSGLVSNRTVLPHGEWREGASSALLDHSSNDGVTINIAYGVDDLPHRPLLVALCRLIVKIPTLEVATKSLLCQQLKIPG